LLYSDTRSYGLLLMIVCDQSPTEPGFTLGMLLATWALMIYWACFLCCLAVTERNCL